MTSSTPSHAKAPLNTPNPPPKPTPSSECKSTQIDTIIESEIRSAHYRLEAGVTPLLDEPGSEPGEHEKLLRAKALAREYITRAGDEAREDVAEPGNELRRCPCHDDEEEAGHLKAWMRWHAEWKIHNAERAFQQDIMRHPRRERWEKTEERFDRVCKYISTAFRDMCVHILPY